MFFDIYILSFIITIYSTSIKHQKKLREREREREKREREWDRQTDRQTDRHTYGEKEKSGETPVCVTHFYILTLYLSLSFVLPPLPFPSLLSSIFYKCFFLSYSIGRYITITSVFLCIVYTFFFSSFIIVSFFMRYILFLNSHILFLLVFESFHISVYQTVIPF